MNPNLNFIPFQQSQFQPQQLPFQQVVYSSKKLEHINMVIPPTMKVGGVFIGDTVALLNPEILEDKKIKAVLCCNQ